METVIISDKKLKIILSSYDMERYGLSCDNIGLTENCTINSLRTILKEAVSDAGIDSEVKDMMIEAYPCHDGSCELFVSLRDRGDLPSGILPVTCRKSILRVVYCSNNAFENALQLLKGNVNIIEKDAVRDIYTGRIVLDISLSSEGEDMVELFSALLLSFGAERVSIVNAADFSEERAEKLNIS